MWIILQTMCNTGKVLHKFLRFYCQAGFCFMVWLDGNGLRLCFKGFCCFIINRFIC